MFVGRFVGPLLLLTLGDIFTRRTLLIANLFLNLLGLTLLVVTPSLALAGVTLFVSMFGAVNAMFLSYAFVS